MERKTYNPDVLSCLANLSNDEVFTPPTLVNQMLDLLPEEIWHDSHAKFLDPVSKTGIFLREIAKRLMAGLVGEIPDVQERANHIFTKQLYGIAITELTAMLSRRSLYCSKKADGDLSVCTDFHTADGNIFFHPIAHTWENGKCKYCGASQEVYDRGDLLESHAYNFIHPASIQKFIGTMKFDVIIGNPPYQLDDGGNGASAKPIYQLFVDKSKRLSPRYIVMIIPSRWFSGGKGLDSFRDEMLHDNRIYELHDFNSASDCFSNVEIKGGVCYFLWKRDYHGNCKVVTHSGNEIISEMTRPLLEKDSDVFIRHNKAISILHKVQQFKEPSFSTIVSSRKPFGLPTNFTDFVKEKSDDRYVKIYANNKVGYISKNQIVRNVEYMNKWKILMPKAIGSGDMTKDIMKPILGEPRSVCTETYILIGPQTNKNESENVISYIETKFFHFMLGLKKITQDTTSKTYQFIPLQDFNEPWTDEKLYKKYNLTQEEIDFIESMIRPME